jgi:uncharacterized protein YkwD
MFTTKSQPRETTTKARRTRRIATIVAAFAVVALSATACLPPPPPAPTDAITAGVLNAMNRDRAANGLGTLGWNNQLGDLATNWANHLAAANGGLVHQNLTNVLYSPGYEGYRTLGENLLVGPQTMTTDEMEAAWMASSGHRANILRGAFTTAGVGYAWGNSRIWVAVEFGG